jgi:hypothetical protein
MVEYNSKTWNMWVGCGSLFITVIFNEEKIEKIIIHRASKFICDATFRDALNRIATFQVRRSPLQLVKDLRGSLNHHCETYHVGCTAYSCSDAVAKVMKDLTKEITNETITV